MIPATPTPAGSPAGAKRGRAGRGSRAAAELRRLRAELAARTRELERRDLEREGLQAILLSTLQCLTTGVLAVGRDGIVIAANPAACAIFGKSIAEAAGRKLGEVLPPIPARGELLAALFGEAPAPARAEWRVERNGHRMKTIDLRAVPAAPPYDRHLRGLVLAEDATDLRRFENQEMVRSRLSGIGELAMNLAHEIRNPLGAISLCATTLAHELKDDAARAGLARELVAGVQALGCVVNNALEFARPRRVALMRVNLAEVMRDALRYVEHPMLQKGIRLETDFGEAGGSEPAIAGDEEQLRQVFLNLFLNAVQAAGEGGLLRATLAPAWPGAWEAAVSDDGVGIAEEDRQRIFDPFFTTKEKGSGIGLAVVHRILTAHAAQIEVESAPGAGATFRILFPPHPILQELAEAS